MLPPPHPASRYPLREYDIALRDVIGWTRDDVLARLGKPNEKQQGNLWASDSPGLAFQRDSFSGELRKLAVFGPVPRAILVGAPYETWTYHNVRGATWILYFAHPPFDDARNALEKIVYKFRALSPRVVVETTSYPTGAVF